MVNYLVQGYSIGYNMVPLKLIFFLLKIKFLVSKKFTVNMIVVSFLKHKHAGRIECSFESRDSICV